LLSRNKLIRRAKEGDAGGGTQTGYAGDYYYR